MHDEYVQKERPTDSAISGDTEIERMAKSLRFQLLFQLFLCCLILLIIMNSLPESNLHNYVVGVSHCSGSLTGIVDGYAKNL